MLKIFRPWNPEFIPEEMLHFYFFLVLNRKFICDEEAQSSASKWGLKEEIFLTKENGSSSSNLLVSSIEDAKCEPSQGCHNPSHDNDTVHQQKNTHEIISHSLSTFFETNFAELKPLIFWILNPNLISEFKIYLASRIA